MKLQITNYELRKPRFRRFDVLTFRRFLVAFLPCCLLAFPFPSALSASSAVHPSSFILQLSPLPPLTAAGAPRVWGWGHVAWDPANPEHVAYARVAGGVIADAHRPHTVRGAAVLASATDAKLALRLHPYKSVTRYWRKGDGSDPTHSGARFKQELSRLARDLLAARAAAGDVPIDRVFIDCETWQRDSPRARDRGRWNAAMQNKHDLVARLIRRCLGPVRIEWYNYSPRWATLTLREQTAAASLSLYTPGAAYAVELTETITFQFARGLDSTTVYFTLDAGWRPDPDGKRTWSWSHASNPRRSYRLGKLLTGFRFRSVHDVVDFSAFHPQNENWPPHCLAFFRALSALPPYQGGIQGGSFPPYQGGTEGGQPRKEKKDEGGGMKDEAQSAANTNLETP